MADIVTENAELGTGPEIWDIFGAGDLRIQGFATRMSVDRGEVVDFKVDTPADAYRVDIYRLGYYGGSGARRVATVRPDVALPQTQPPGLLTPETGLLDCANWAVSVSWAVPADAISGIYLGHLVGEDGVHGESHIVFVVRDDAGTAEILFQTADTTWQAYNTYGDSCLYEFLIASGRRAFEVSYNRPFRTREAEGGANWLFNAEYPTLRWLEANGYDVAYCTGADVDRDPGQLLRHRVFASVGHDEYWTADQRAAVEAARDAGVHLAFLSGNEVFWKSRWSADADGVLHRTLACYKDTHADEPIDPTGVWTGTWRDARFSPPLDGARPENALTGTMFGAQGFTDLAITVPARDGRLRLWRDTSLAHLTPGTTATLALGTLGYEWDICPVQHRPPGLVTLSSTEIDTPDLLLDEGKRFGPGTATHQVTLYRHRSGALVFGAGTAQWAWGLDAEHDTHGNATGPADPRMQQAMVNLLADMDVAPGSLRPGLVRASAPAQPAVPTSTITAPAAEEVLVPGDEIVVTGTAGATGGRVGAVEVSVDGGLTWRPADGRESWRLAWTPHGTGRTVLRSRAVADDGHLEVPAPGVAVTLGQRIEAGPGGPVLVVVNGGMGEVNPFAGYLTEILRAEGLMAFATIELSDLMTRPDPAAHLRGFALVVLAHTGLLPDQRDLVAEFVAAGGRLVAMRPDPALAPVFGLEYRGPRPPPGADPRRFLGLVTADGPGAGLTAGALQYHGDADDHDLAGATPLAHFHDDIDTPSDTPAVTEHRHGAGVAVAFAFDLAATVVLMRQGNPEWADSEGEGAAGVLPATQPSATSANPLSEYRPLDMFVRTDGRMWFEPRLLMVPQADELQRFLANVVLAHAGRRLPRLWYLPAGHRSVVVTTGDGEHYTPAVMQVPIDDVTARGGRFTTYLRREQISNALFPQIVLDSVTEAAWRASGHGVGVHVFAVDESGANVQNFDTVHAAYEDITTALRDAYGHGARTARSHTIDWTGWVDTAAIEAEFGTAMDLNYYHYFEFAAANAFPDLALPVDRTAAHGWFTGSGLAQRFCDAHGVLLPIYQLLTPWSDEFFTNNGYTVAQVDAVIEEMVQAAEDGYCSALVANVHHGRYVGDHGDQITGPWARGMWNRAVTRGTPLLSAEDYLDFVQARAAARLTVRPAPPSTLDIDLTANGGEPLTVMLPGADLLVVTTNGTTVTPVLETFAGRAYAMVTTSAAETRIRATYATVV